MTADALPPPPALASVRRVESAKDLPVEYRYGPPPEHKGALLSRVADGGDSVLLLLVPEDDLMAFARDAEDPSTIAARVCTCRGRLKHSREFGTGELHGLSQRVEGLGDWCELVGALSDGERLRSVIVRLVEALFDGRRQQLRKVIENHFRDDFLSLAEQTVIYADGLRLGLDRAEVRQLMKTVADEKPGRVIENPAELKRGSGVRDVVDLVQKADRHLEEALDDLRASIANESLTLWIQVQNLSDQPIAKSVQRAFACYDAAGSKASEKRRQLDRGAWDVLWNAGLPWLDLAWPTQTGGVAKQRVRSLGELRAAMRAGGIAPLRLCVQAGILGLWLRCLKNIPASVVEAAEQAERAVERRGLDGPEPFIALWRIAWRLGIPRIELAPDLYADDAASFCTLDCQDPRLLRLTIDGVVAAWAEEVLQERGFGDRLAAGLARDPDGAKRARRAQWLLGSRELHYGALNVAEPDAAVILDAAQESGSALEAFGRALHDGTFLQWLEDVPNDIVAPRVEHLTKLVGHTLPPRILAQFGFAILGQQAFILLHDDRPACRFDSPADLVERAHEHWTALSAPQVLEALETWLTLRLRLDLSASTYRRAIFPLLALLAAAGDTTVRHLDGFPVGHDVEVRFGGLGVAPAAVLKAFVGWIKETPAPPRSVEIAFATGALGWWTTYHVPDLARDMAERLATQRDPRSRFMTCLWTLGYDRLLVNGKVSVASLAELLQVARSNLSDIERLFDAGALASWAPDKAQRLRLGKLATAVNAAQGVLARTGPAGGVPAGQVTRGDLCARLVVHNRAALAIAALGGALDEWKPAQARFRFAGLPHDLALDVPIVLAQTRVGDSPVSGVLVSCPQAKGRFVVDDQDLDVRRSRGLTRQLDQHSLFAHFEVDDLPVSKRKSTETVELWTVDSTGSVVSATVVLDLQRNFPAGRFKRALADGAWLGLATTACAIACATVLGYLTWYWAEYFGSGPPQDFLRYELSRFGALALPASIVALFSITYVIFQYYRWRRAPAVAPPLVTGPKGVAPSSKHGLLALWLGLAALSLLVAFPLWLVVSDLTWLASARIAGIPFKFCATCRVSWELLALGHGLFWVTLALFSSFVVALAQHRFRLFSALTALTGAVLTLGWLV